MSALLKLAEALADGLNHELCKRALIELGTAAEAKMQEVCGFAWDLGAENERLRDLVRLLNAESER